MSEVIAIRIPQVASEVEREAGGKWLLDKDGYIVGGLAFVTYPMLECVRLRTDEVETRLSEREDSPDREAQKDERRFPR